MLGFTFQIGELTASHVYIKDKDTVDQKLSNLIQDGKNRLQVIADFDATLSAFTLKGERCVTCHSEYLYHTVYPQGTRDTGSGGGGHSNGNCTTLLGWGHKTFTLN